jgi:hypothetical protein
MQIETTCRCGKHYKAAERLAGKHLKCPDCGQALVVPTLEQAAMQSAYAEAKEYERKRRTLRIAVIVGFVCLLLLLCLAFQPQLLPMLYVAAVVFAIAGTIGNIWLIIHAFRKDDVASGIVMALSFVFPPLWFYTLYYLVTRWDGTAPFQLSAGALCGFGSLLCVTVVFLIPSANRQVAKKQQSLDLAKFGLAGHRVYDAGQKPSPDLVQKELTASGMMTADQFQEFASNYEICWDSLPTRLSFRDRDSETVIAYHRSSLRDKRDEVATGWLDGSVRRLPYEQLMEVLRK